MESSHSARDWVDAQRRHLAALADAWWQEGAAAFGVWLDGAPLSVWQRDAAIDTPVLTAPISFGKQGKGELRVVGVRAPAAAARLNAEAGLLARLIEIENEVEAVTSDLIDTQDQLLAFYDLTKSTHQHLEIVPMLRAICAESARLVKTDASIAWIFLPSGERILAQHPEGFLAAPAVECLIEHSGTAELIEECMPSHNALVTPLTLRGARAAGVGWLKKIGERFSSPDLKLARALADQAGAQIENVLLYQETLTQTKLKNEMELASRIQLGLMPRREPVAPGIQVYGNARPALRVGGDFFDYILRSNVSLFFSVGDVAGKGMSAALLMSVVQTTTRNVERFMPVPTPAKILYRVSDDLYNELSELGTFVTQFICQYDSSQRTCTFANAGHSPVVYRPAEAEARLLVADGTAMGVLPQDAWVDHVLPIHPGDVLIAATDGFVEAHNAQEEMFGYDNLLRLVNQVASRSASEIGVALYDAVDRFAATHPQDDDQTVIVIKGI